MSNISTTNSSYTSGGIDSRSTLDGTSQATFQQMNGAASGVIAIETVLGDGPTLRGNLADLVARLAVALTADGAVRISVSGAFTGLTDNYGLIADGTSTLRPRNICPFGKIIAYAGSSAPDDWLLCNGQAVSRTTYADLFDAIGTQFGVGDGVNTFNVPDLRGRVPMGQDNMGGLDIGRVTAASTGGGNADTLGGTGGAETHTLVTGEMPAHTHDELGDTSFGIDNGATTVMMADANEQLNSEATGHVTGSTGGGGAHSNTQPWMAITYLIYSGV